MIKSQVSGGRAIAGGGLRVLKVDQDSALRCCLWSGRPHYYSSAHCSSKLCLRYRNRRHCKKSRSVVISCKSSPGSFGHRPNRSEDNDDNYVEATILISETIKHYQMHLHGFYEEMQWHSSAQSIPSLIKAKDPRPDISPVGIGFLRRFRNPTIFLKISCDGDYVLPIIVGEHAVEKLIDSLHEEDGWDCPDHFQLVRNLSSDLSCKVKMVRITERVLNTYFAKIYLQKPGENHCFSVDARPSDAINVARRCQAPIFVSKQIVLSDAIRIVYGTSRNNNKKSVYDVSLDSAIEGPNALSEELTLVQNMNLAIIEERYHDAAVWKNKLKKLRESRHDS